MSTRRWAGIAVGLFVMTAGLCGAGLTPLTWLVLRDVDSTRYAFAAGEGHRFALAWRHSVERQDWIEKFEIRNGAIVLTATRFKTFGAGVPDDAGQRTRLDDGWVVMEGIDRVVDPLAVQAGAGLDYRLWIDDRWLSLSSTQGSPILNFEVVDAPLIALLWPAVNGWRAESLGTS